MDAQVNEPPPRGGVDQDIGIGDGGVLRAGAAQRRGRGEAQILADDVEQVERRLARRDGDVVHIVSEEVDDVVGGVEHQRGGHKVLQKARVHRFHFKIRAGHVLHAHDAGLHRLEGGHVEHGRGQIVRLARAVVDVDFLRAASGVEGVGILVGRLALAQEQVAAVFQRGMENGEQAPLQYRLEVNHHVAAANQVQLAKRRVGEHVVGREDNHAPDALGDAVRYSFDGDKE